jgi:hypothetical protein
MLLPDRPARAAAIVLAASAVVSTVLFACGGEAGSASRIESAPSDGRESGSSRRRRNCALPKFSSIRDEADGGAVDASTVDAGAVPISDADHVIASLRPRFRACYQDGLQSDPSMTGCVILRARVSSDGSVGSTESMVDDGLSATVVACLAAVLRSASFSPPGGEGSTLQVPITFIQRGSSR